MSEKTPTELWSEFLAAWPLERVRENGMTLLMDEVVIGIHIALARAQRDYESWTGGDWLWQAPDYLLTTYIAREIAERRKDRTFYIALESNVGVSIDDAG